MIIVKIVLKLWREPQPTKNTDNDKNTSIHNLQFLKSPLE